MKRIIVALALAAGLVTVPAHADAASKGTAVVLGDSISDRAHFTDRTGASGRDIWWAKLARRANVTTYAYAERGSGYTHPGKCNFASGSTIAQRASRPHIGRRMQQAKYVIVEAGVNDWRTCYLTDDGRARVRLSTEQEIVDGVDAAMDAIDAAVTNERKVIVTVPYGSLKSLKPYRARIERILKAAAAEHGFQYVDTARGTLRGSRTVDGVHPSLTGSQALYQRIWTKSTLHLRGR